MSPLPSMYASDRFLLGLLAGVGRSCTDPLAIMVKISITKISKVPKEPTASSV